MQTDYTLINDPYNAIARAATALSASPDRHTPTRSVAGRVVNNLSRKNLQLARANLCNEAMMRFLLLCYEQDDTGLCNIDELTGRVLIPTPWGRLGHRPFGLRRLEADVLRRIVFLWAAPGKTPPVWDYSPTERSWALNIFDYPHFENARPWLQTRTITAKLFDEVHTQMIGGEA